MLVKDIKKLPKTFYFKSNINPFNIIYKAEKGRGIYTITCTDGGSEKWIYEKEIMYDCLRNDDFTVVEPDFVEANG